jgi:DNA polymerase III delta prime subunit
MHAYLLVGREISNNQTSITKLSKKLHAKIMEFPIGKIEDVRNLNNSIRLSFNEPTLILCRDIHSAGEEALNALLKNLEEPQENVYFALTTSSIRKVLPTIVSRCQIVRSTPSGNENCDHGDEEIEKFLKMKTGDKFSHIDKIRDRAKAIEFTENMVNFMHRSLHEKDVKYSISKDNIRLALKTLSGLNANGNVNLQLSNFVINYN